MKPKQVIIELGVLFAIYALALFCWPAFFEIVKRSVIYDFNLHDTYFVMSASPWDYLVIWTFSSISTLVYFSRAIIRGYKNNIVNAILIGSNFLLSITLIKVYRMILIWERSMISNSQDLTRYSTPSGLNSMPPSKVEHQHFDNYMFVPITIFMLILVVSSIITGKNWKTNTHGQTPS